MIRNIDDLSATLVRIRRFQDQVALLLNVETDPHNYRLSASGFQSEINRMKADVLAYLAEHMEENATLTDAALTEIADELFCDLDSREAGG